MDNNSVNGGFPQPTPQPMPMQPQFPQPMPPQPQSMPPQFPTPQAQQTFPQPVGVGGLDLTGAAGAQSPDAAAQAIQARIAAEKKNHRHKIIQVIIIVILAIATIVLAAFLVMTKIEFDEKSRDVDGQIERAVVDAKKAQYDADKAEFFELEKKPYFEFVGPEDYGSLSFQYPKTWSQYVSLDASDGGNFEAYFNPGVVDKVGGDAWSGEGVYALRVIIFNNTSPEVIADFYKSYVSDGFTTSNLVTVGEASGMRYDGYITSELKGSLFVFKLRDKAVVIRTDSEIFRGDFDELLKTIKYND
ncbi:MAG: hypothetical protein LBE03_00260 [Candidatus Nomurabacteria bacterium]|jgi:hypothetical protein|nr:hypothetical protein [Candidatus Nomurabacteria bacterium]